MKIPYSKGGRSAPKQHYVDLVYLEEARKCSGRPRKLRRITRHGIDRLNQRSLRFSTINLIAEYGESFSDNDDRLYINPRVALEHARQHRSDARSIERHGRKFKRRHVADTELRAHDTETKFAAAGGLASAALHRQLADTFERASRRGIVVVIRDNALITAFATSE